MSSCEELIFWQNVILLIMRSSSRMGSNFYLKLSIIWLYQCSLCQSRIHFHLVLVGSSCCSFVVISFIRKLGRQNVSVHEVDQKEVKKKPKTCQQHQNPIMLIRMNPCLCLNPITAIFKCSVLFSYCLAVHISSLWTA